jgi:endonuclease YncB( thermonuclease family)
MPAQPLANEARAWLDRQLQGRAVLLVPYNVDRYGRLVASVWTRPFGWRWMPFGLPLLNWLRQDISLHMLRSGMASVYTGHDVEFGGRQAQYTEAEQQAR